MRFNLKKLEQYQAMPSYFLKDERLNLEEKGLLATIYSLPNSWDFSLKGLCTITKTGITKMRRIIADLECKGWLTRKEIRNEKGQFLYEWIVRIKAKKVEPIHNSLMLKRLKKKLNMKSLTI